MGNAQSDLEQKKRLKFNKMFSNNFQLIENKIDDIFGQISLYANKNTHKVEVLVKSISYSEEGEIKLLIDTMQDRILHPIPNLLSIFHMEIIELDNAFCGQGKIVKFYVEYLNRSLKDELKKRRKHKTYFFSEEQLWKIFLSLVNAIRNLHEKKIFHGQIRFENVLIDGDYHMKLVEKSLLTSTNWQIENKEAVKLIKGKGILFSPSILNCLKHQKTQLAAYDPFKADVFAVGMIMLECCTLKKAEDFYNYQNFKIDVKQIRNSFYDPKKRYSWELMNTIQRMLDEDDEQRPSFEQISQKIKRISNQTIRQLNMTLNESFLNQSMRSYV